MTEQSPFIMHLDSGDFEIDADMLKQLSTALCEHLGLDQIIEFSLSLVDIAEITELNLCYRQKKGPTDVISFALEEGPEFVISDSVKARQLGEIYLCYPVVQDNARRFAISEEVEFANVFVHSLLHLLGYDHQDDRAESRMNELTTAIVDKTQSIK